MNKYLVVGKHKTKFSVLVNGQSKLLGLTGNMLKADSIYVGDFVEIDENSELISKLYPRKNFLIRPLIANMDQVMIVMSIKKPEFSSLLVEKFLAYTHFANVSPLLIITKSDITTEEEIINVKTLLSNYNIKYFIINNFALDNKEAFLELLKEKKTVLMGQTGVGKSSFINALSSDFSRLTGEYSAKLGRGKHTTREVLMLPFLGGYIVDTPGFSSFELPMTKIDLAQNYPSFHNLVGKCRFSNCLHLSEHSCYIKTSVDQGFINNITYQNYVKISGELPTKLEDY